MKKFNELWLVVFFALAATTLASAPASAGVYLNAESNDGYTGSEYQGRTVDVHVGYEGTAGNVDYYIQGGPALVAVDGIDGTETELSGKVGGTYNISEATSIYGEFAGATNGDFDNSYNLKVGAKYKF